MSRRSERRRIARLERQLGEALAREEDMRVMLFNALRQAAIDRARLQVLRELLADDVPEMAREQNAETIREPSRPQLRLLQGGRKGSVSSTDPISTHDRHGMRAV